MFVRGISEIAELLVSVKRLQDFLSSDEFHNDSTQFKINNNDKQQQQNEGLALRNVVAKWNVDSKETALANLNISLPKGQLLGVIGPVGSGKSSLFQAILGTYICQMILFCTLSHNVFLHLRRVKSCWRLNRVERHHFLRLPGALGVRSNAQAEHSLRAGVQQKSVHQSGKSLRVGKRLSAVSSWGSIDCGRQGCQLERRPEGQNQFG